jgi:hypothetical protein
MCWCRSHHHAQSPPEPSLVKYFLLTGKESLQVWMVFVSITTTGYGDFVAKTHIGRIASCAAMGLGPIIVAFITATITQVPQKSPFQSKRALGKSPTDVLADTGAVWR